MSHPADRPERSGARLASNFCFRNIRIVRTTRWCYWQASISTPKASEVNTFAPMFLHPCFSRRHWYVFDLFAPVFISFSHVGDSEISRKAASGNRFFEVSDTVFERLVMTKWWASAQQFFLSFTRKFGAAFKWDPLLGPLVVHCTTWLSGHPRYCIVHGSAC